MSSDAFHRWGEDAGAHYGRGRLDHGNDSGAQAHIGGCAVEAVARHGERTAVQDEVNC
jgi:hypothetical protein